MNNNSNNLSCSFTESLVDYLYGECGIGERERLEKHVSGCSECSIRLKEIGQARFAVAEWKAIEFAALPTPKIDFISEKSAKSPGILTNLGELLASLLRVPRFAAASAAFVILIAVTGGILIFSFRDGVNETAALDSEQDKNSVAIDQTDPSELDRPTQMANPDVASVQVSPTTNDTGKDRSQRLPSKDRKGTIRRTMKKTPLQNETAVTISNRPARELPRLNDFEDYQDNSLRLSEILDEIDSGK